MLIRTAPREPVPAIKARLLAAGGLFAAVEFGLALTLGGFFAVGRAEPLVFVAFRPWLLLALVAAMAALPWRARAGGYAIALVLASAGETAFLLALGADGPWPGTATALLAGALLAAILDLLVQSGRRLAGRWGRAAGALLGAALLLIPGGLGFYDRLLLDRPAEPSAARPPLMLLTGLPIIWGEGGAFAPGAGPTESYRALAREFRVRPLDSASGAALTGPLLLVAQPRALAPEELVAIDSWVRRGGRALFLIDPALDWPSELPLGDPRRPPPVNLLGPLLGHWGIRLDPPLRDAHGRAPLHIFQALPEAGWRLAVSRPGRLDAPDCRPLLPDLIVSCAIGRGQAMLVADADLLRDDLWAPHGPLRHQRTADNPLVVAGWLDRLAGVSRQRVDGRVEWLNPEQPRARAVALALLPAGLGLVAAAGVARRGRR